MGRRASIDALFADLSAPTPPHPLNWRLNEKRTEAFRALHASAGKTIGKRAIALLTPELLRFERTVGAENA